MTNEANKALMRRYHAAWSAGDTDQLRQMLAEDCVTHNLVTGEKRPVEFEVEACRMWHESFSGVAVNIEQLVAEADRVTVCWRLHSTHSAEFLGIPATNQAVLVPGLEINRIAAGKIAEIWRLSDTFSLMQQLGAV